MDNKITLNNKDLNSLWNYSDFTINDKGELIPIAWWNIIGKLIKVIKDRNGEITQRIHEIIKKTLHDIYEYNSPEKLIYIEKDFTPLITFKPDFPKRLYYPAYILAKKIVQKFKTDEIIVIANQIMAQKELYPAMPNNKKIEWDKEGKEDSRVLDFLAHEDIADIKRDFSFTKIKKFHG